MYHTSVDNKNNNKPTTKPIDVNSNITPITQVAVGVLRADLWHAKDSTIEFLNDQLVILNDRLTAANSMHHHQMISYIHNGLIELNAILLKRSEQQDI